jgi:peptidoglycan hydrolase CwlO-like protein
MKPLHDYTEEQLLRLILADLEAQHAAITLKVAELKAQIAALTPGKRSAKNVAKPNQHRMSAEGRARVIAAQKKRWAKVRKEQKIAKKQAEVAKATRALKRSRPRINGAAPQQPSA